MAEAADKQLILTGIALVFIVLTFGATAWATNAASNAASAASEQSRIATETFEKLERPWIFVEIHPRIFRTKPEHNQDPIYPYMLFDIVNYGRVPAIIDGCWAQPAIAKPTPEKPILDARWSGPLGPDKRFRKCKSFFPEGLKFDSVLVDLREDTEDRAVKAIPTLESDEDLCFFIIIRYRDIRGATYESMFCWRYDCADAQWVKYDGDEYNRQT